MICPLMSRLRMVNRNGVEMVSPSFVDCVQDKCAVWSLQNRGCGLKHEE